jgi:hypothetical protein
VAASPDRSQIKSCSGNSWGTFFCGRLAATKPFHSSRCCIHTRNSRFIPILPTASQWIATFSHRLPHWRLCRPADVWSSSNPALDAAQSHKLACQPQTLPWPLSANGRRRVRPLLPQPPAFSAWGCSITSIRHYSSIPEGRSHKDPSSPLQSQDNLVRRCRFALPCAAKCYVLLVSAPSCDPLARGFTPRVWPRRSAGRTTPQPCPGNCLKSSGHLGFIAPCHWPEASTAWYLPFRLLSRGDALPPRPPPRNVVSLSLVTSPWSLPFILAITSSESGHIPGLIALIYFA